MVTWTVDNGHGDQGNERKKGEGRERKPATATTAACLRQSRSPIHSARYPSVPSDTRPREYTKERYSPHCANPVHANGVHTPRLNVIRTDELTLSGDSLSVLVWRFNLDRA